uniref:Uncharacterized protein n=1 Tax=Globisporangium ultimum (strain ATCC 200006 / CBS 805.95 / DAOM BR144) TaxID=431595 RepID=K3WQY8_GLOUD
MVRLSQSSVRAPSTTTATAVLAAIASLSLAPSAVNAHGYITVPMAEFSDGAMKTNFIAKMDPAFPGKFNDNPQANVDTFTKAFQASGKYASLRDLLQGHGEDCGNTKLDATPKPIPSDGMVSWQNPDTNEGFVPSHTGPCEIWLDDTPVLKEENCAGRFPGNPAQMKVDFSSCTGKCVMRFYWLTLQEPAWQIYKNCIPLAGGEVGAESYSFNSNNNGNDGNAKANSYNQNDNMGYNANNETALAESSESPTATPSMPSQYPSASSMSPTPAPEPSQDYSEPSSTTPSPTQSVGSFAAVPESTHQGCNKMRGSKQY